MLFVPLKKEGYDPFIDYLKGVCILFVVLAHCLPPTKHLLFSLWGAQAVPLFLMIQVFHTYKKGIENVKFNYYWNKIFHRIVKPFILLLSCQILLQALLSPTQITRMLKNIIVEGGGRAWKLLYLDIFTISNPLTHNWHYFQTI